MLRWLTNEGVKALWFIVPVDSQEVDRDTSQHDGQADATHHRLRVQGEDEQEGPEEEVNYWPYETDLKDRTKQRCVIRLRVNTAACPFQILYGD